jgi:hypothetical protein
MYPDGTPGKIICRALTIPKPLLKNRLHLQLKFREVRRLNGKVKSLQYDTNGGSPNDLLRFAKATRAYFAARTGTKDRRCRVFLDGLIEFLLRLLGSCQDPAVLLMNEHAINDKLDMDMNPAGVSGGEPAGLSRQLLPYYIRSILRQVSTATRAHLAPSLAGLERHAAPLSLCTKQS